MAKQVAKVYGDALFSLAVESKELDTVWDEVKLVIKATSDNPDFLPVLTHPGMTADDKGSVIKEVFGKSFSDTMMGFFDVLIRKGRIGEIVSILNYFDEKAKEHEQIGVVYVSTPMTLSDGQKSDIEKRILAVSGYESLEINYDVDKTLLGGMVIRIGDRVLDNSIRSKIDRMRGQLSGVRI